MENAQISYKIKTTYIPFVLLNTSEYGQEICTNISGGGFSQHLYVFQDFSLNHHNNVRLSVLFTSSVRDFYVVAELCVLPFCRNKTSAGRDTTNVMRQHLSLMNAQRSVCAFNNSAFNSKSFKH